MNKIEIGDRVKVLLYGSEKTFVRIEGILNHIPSDVGDLWYIETEEKVFAINPNHSSFLGIVKTIIKEEK